MGSGLQEHTMRRDRQGSAVSTCESVQACAQAGMHTHLEELASLRHTVCTAAFDCEGRLACQRSDVKQQCSLLKMDVCL